MIRVVGAALVVALTAACGGPRVDERTFEFAAPEALAADSLVLRLDRVPATPQLAADAVRSELETLGYSHVRSDLGIVDGVAVVHARRGDGEDAQRAIAIVSTVEWRPETASALLSALYREPGARDPEPAVFVTAGPRPTFGIRYLFGNDWWARLESELFTAFADPALDPADSGPYIAAARRILASYGATELAELEAMFDQLPRPGAGDGDYQPVATLLAIGLALGERAEQRHARLAWVPGSEAMARYFALVDDRHDERVLRPIDYVIQLYRTPIHRGLAAYEELVDVRFAD